MKIDRLIGILSILLQKPRFKRIVSVNNDYFKNKKVIYAPHPSRWCYIGKDADIKDLIMNKI